MMISVVSERVGLKMNMANSHIVPTPVKIGSYMLEIVDDYVYLEQT